jgi:hypothetical protein
MDIRDQNGYKIDINKLEKTEQDLANQYIEENDIVLELGARYGSVSCIINSKLKSDIESEIYEAIGEHIDVESAIWEIHGSSVSKDIKIRKHYWLKLVHNKEYYMHCGYITQDDIIVI